MAYTTDALMEELMAMLKNEQSQSHDSQDKNNESSNHAKQFKMPAYDPSIDYIKKIGEQSDVLQKVESLYEDHSADYLNMLKDVVH